MDNFHALREASCDEEIIYNYYLYLKEKNTQPGTDLIRNGKGINKMLYYFVVDYNNKNKTPIIVSDEEYKNFNSTKLYHGFKNYSHCANILWDPLYHYGEGVWCSGMYATDTIDEAYSYTRDNGIVNKERILDFKIATDNIASYSFVKNLSNYILNYGYNDWYKKPENLSLEQSEKLDRLMNFLEKVNDLEFRVALVTDRSTISAWLGFDAIVKPGNMNKNTINYILLNRGKMVVSESMFRWHMNHAGGEYSLHANDNCEFQR